MFLMHGKDFGWGTFGFLKNFDFALVLSHAWTALVQPGRASSELGADFGHLFVPKTPPYPNFYLVVL